MIIFGIGIDIVEIARLAAAIERQGQAFLDRCFTIQEQAYCHSHRDPSRSYAARFAAKEAVAKAFGTGFGAELAWTDVEVCRKPSGAPFIQLHAAGAQTARRMGIQEILLSLSHSEHYAVANAIALKSTSTPPP